MKLTFLGPLGRVTGSASLLTDDTLGVRILIDFGMQQGEGEDGRWNTGPLPFDAAALTHVILTHAHIDHCGLIPRLYREGFTGKVLCTPETAALARLELEDCARVSGVYSVAAAQAVRFDERDAAFGTYMPIARDVFVQFFRTAHILGAVAVRISWGPRGPRQRSIMFSGDLGTNVDGHERFLTLRHRMEPQPSTYAVVESTYGDRARDLQGESFLGRIEGLRRELVMARARGGQLLIASFAMDRLQTILLDLAYLCASDEQLAETPILVHAPLGRKISAVYAREIRRKDICSGGRVRPRWLSKSAFERLGVDPQDTEAERAVEDTIVSVLDPDAVRRHHTTEDLLRPVHRWLERREPLVGHHIVVASSGMLEGGPITAYLADLLRDPTATLILSGYASPSTLSGELFQLGPLPAAERERLAHDLALPDETSLPAAHVRAHITSLRGYSAHADQQGLLDWLVHEHNGQRCVAGETIFIQHGNDAARETLRTALLARAPDATVVCPTPACSLFDLDGERLPTYEELLARFKKAG